MVWGRRLACGNRRFINCLSTSMSRRGFQSSLRIDVNFFRSFLSDVSVLPKPRNVWARCTRIMKARGTILGVRRVCSAIEPCRLCLTDVKSPALAPILSRHFWDAGKIRVRCARNMTVGQRWSTAGFPPSMSQLSRIPSDASHRKSPYWLASIVDVSDRGEKPGPDILYQNS